MSREDELEKIEKCRGEEEHLICRLVLSLVDLLIENWSEVIFGDRLDSARSSNAPEVVLALPDEKMLADGLCSITITFTM